MKHARLCALALAALAALSCAAAAAQTGASKYPKLKPFTDEDILEGRIEGRWTAGPAFDNSQLQDPSVPVVVKGLNLVSGDPASKFIGLMKIQGADLENRGQKATRSVRLRWALTKWETDDTEAPIKVLAEGVTDPFDVRVGPAESLKTDTPPVFFNRIAKPFLEGGRLEGRFQIVVGVSEVVFEDGSIWQGQ